MWWGKLQNKTWLKQSDMPDIESGTVWHGEKILYFLADQFQTKIVGDDKGTKCFGFINKKGRCRLVVDDELIGSPADQLSYHPNTSVTINGVQFW
jgi:hypothetical protein